MKILIEHTVIEDVLYDREDHVDGSAAVLSIVEAGYASGFVVPQTVLDAYDRLRDHMGRSQTHGVMVDLLSLVSTVPIDDEVINEALALGWSEFRQAMLAAAAIHSDITHLVVRNPRNYRSLKMPVMTPEELVAQSESETLDLNLG